jgi:peptidase S24-like protein
MSSSAAVWRPVVTEILRERLGAGESIWLPIQGRSMRPLLRSGARILVAAAARVRFGDVLAYESEGTLVCHRVIGRRGAALLTRADHRGTGPEVVTERQILGVVTAFERRGVSVDLLTARQRTLAILAAARSFAVAAWYYALQAVAGFHARRRTWPRA